MSGRFWGGDEPLTIRRVDVPDSGNAKKMVGGKNDKVAEAKPARGVVRAGSVPR